MSPFRTERFANGVVIEFVDLTNRYFGDYHRVCVEVRITVGVRETGSSPASAATPSPAAPPTPGRLERMGVPGAEVEATRNRLVADYLRHAGRYLALTDYPARLLAARAAAPRRPRPVLPR